MTVSGVRNEATRASDRLPLYLGRRVNRKVNLSISGIGVFTM